MTNPERHEAALAEFGPAAGGRPHGVLREQAHDAEREPAVGDLHGELAALAPATGRRARAVVAVLVRELRLEDADEEEDLEEAHRRDLNSAWTPFGTSELDVAAELDVADAVLGPRGRSSRSSRCGRACSTLRTVELLRRCRRRCRRVPGPPASGQACPGAGWGDAERARAAPARGPGTPRRPGRARAPRSWPGHVCAGGRGLFFSLSVARLSFPVGSPQSGHGTRRLPARDAQRRPSARRRRGALSPSGALGAADRPREPGASSRTSVRQQRQAQTARREFCCSRRGAQPSRRPRRSPARPGVSRLAARPALFRSC